MISSPLVSNTINSISELINKQSIRYELVTTEGKLLRKYILPIIISTALYIPICWMLKTYYKDRKPFPYKMPVILWNVILAVLSAIGSLMILINQPMILLHKADPIFLYSFPDYVYHPVVGFVVRIFCLTKVIEYGDTFWLCVKKRPTIFLHLYHHVTVALFCLHSLMLEAPYGHFFVFVNLNIHAVMYAYYAASMIFKGNKTIVAMRPFITLGQLMQMFFGVAICSYELVSINKSSGLEINTIFGLFMYLSYAYLFGDFFIKNYYKSLSPVNTLFAISPIAFLPLLVSILGKSIIFLPTSTIISVLIVVALFVGNGRSYMEYLSPIYFSSESAKNHGVMAKSIRCFAKIEGTDEGSYSNMFCVIMRYSVLPLIAIGVDSIWTSHVSIRSLPLIFSLWNLHGYISGAFVVQKPVEIVQVEDLDESPKLNAINPTLADDPNVVLRRTVPVHNQ